MKEFSFLILTLSLLGLAAPALADSNSQLYCNSQWNYCVARCKSHNSGNRESMLICQEKCNQNLVVCRNMANSVPNQAQPQGPPPGPPPGPGYGPPR